MYIYIYIYMFVCVLSLSNCLLCRFTRVQRLSCCLAILYLTMIANAMWYRTDGQTATQNALNIGPISISVHEIYTSVMSSLTIVPPTLLIVFIFTKSRQRPQTKKRTGQKDTPFGRFYYMILIKLRNSDQSRHMKSDRVR